MAGQPPSTPRYVMKAVVVRRQKGRMAKPANGWAVRLMLRNEKYRSAAEAHPRGIIKAYQEYACHPPRDCITKSRIVTTVEDRQNAMEVRDPLVSVVMPVRNGQRFLDYAIRSVVGQTFPSFELLVIDDFSEDESVAVARQWVNRDSRVVSVPNRDRGLINALNHGIAIARGGFIARVDADDICAPTRFERQIDALRQSRVAVVGSAARMINVRGQVIGEIRHPTRPEDIRRALLDYCCIAHPTTMMRTDVVRALGGYRNAFVHCEDYDLWLRISEHADITNLDECLLDYRIHEAQVTWGSLEQRILSELGAVAAAKRRQAGLPDLIAAGTVMDRTAVIELGVPSEVIKDQILLRTYGAAVNAMRLRQYLSARRALDVLRRQPSVPVRMHIRCGILEAQLVARQFFHSFH